MILRSILKNFVLLFLLLLVSGCGTVGAIKSRMDPEQPMHPYRATYFDCKIINEFCLKPSIWAGIIWGINLAPVMAVDFPISITTDTIALPYDSYFLFEPRGQLHTAIKEHSFEKAKALLEGGADPNAIFEDNTPLVIACDSGNIKGAQVLLMYGADVNKEGHYGSPFSMASGRGDVAMIKLLLKYKVDFSSDYEWALQGACDRCDIEMVRILLDSQPDAELYRHNPELFQKANIEIVRLLIEHGVDLNSKPGHIMTPLFYVIARGGTTSDKVDIIELLIKNGADVNKVIRGYSLLDEAIVRELPKDVIELLKKYGAKNAYELKAEKEKTKK